MELKTYMNDQNVQYQIPGPRLSSGSGSDESILPCRSSQGANGRRRSRLVLPFLLLGLALRMVQPAAGQVTYQRLKSFTGGDGASPTAGLVQGSDGALYGTTFYGGSSGDGTVFKLSTLDGINYSETVLHSFTCGSDGANAYAGLVQGSDGALYGTTAMGGSSSYSAAGTVFKLSTADGTTYSETVPYSFTGGSDGLYPQAGLVQGSDGALYGTTEEGGSSGFGTVFKLSTDGLVYTVLYSFTGGSDGGYPDGGVVIGSDGALYGTTYQGGDSGLGVVFKIAFGTTITVPCPANITQCNDAGQCSAVVTWPPPAATDNCGVSSVVCNPPSGSTFQKGTTTVTCTATDTCGNQASCTFTVTVNDCEPPAVSPISAPVSPVEVASQVSASASFTDNCGPHTAVWDWGDGATSAGAIVEANGSGSVSGSHVYSAAGIYTLRLTVTDEAGNNGQATFEYVVIYDPSAGFVTGGGWINSPAWAYPANSSLSGKATFGFVSR